MQFSLFDLTMNDTCDVWTSPSHLINVATLPCESRKMKNVIITVGYYQRKLRQMYLTASSKWTCRL